MALHKLTATPIGVDFGYHRIRTLMVYFDEQCVDVFLKSYVSKDARGAEAQGLESCERYSFKDLGVKPGAEPTRKQIYDYLTRQADGPFSGAASV